MEVVVTREQSKSIAFFFPFPRAKHYYPRIVKLKRGRRRQKQSRGFLYLYVHGYNYKYNDR